MKRNSTWRCSLVPAGAKRQDASALVAVRVKTCTGSFVPVTVLPLYRTEGPRFGLLQSRTREEAWDGHAYLNL
jgi:hypothetical protein